MFRSFASLRSIPAVVVFALTFCVRLVALARLLHSPYGAPVTGDMKFYADWALRIAHGELTDHHAFYGEPLYAYLLAALFAVGGVQLFWIGLLQALLDACTALLIFKIAALFLAETPRRALMIGGCAALGWAMFIPAAAYCGLLIPTPFVVATWWFCVWWILARRAVARPVEWFGIALVVGLCAMISAATLLALPLLAAALIWSRRRAAAAALITAGIIIGTAPAWAHNLFIARDPVFLSAHGGLNFWIGNNPDANGYPKIPPGLPSDQRQLLETSITVAETSAGHPLLRSAVSRFWSAKARAYIAAHPLDWLRLVTRKLRNFWSAFPYDDLGAITALRDAGIVLPGLRFGLVAALALPGAIFAWRIPRARWLLATLGLQMLALIPVFVNERYRLSAVPGLLLLAAFFVSETAEQIGARKWPRLLAMAAVLAISSAFVFWPPADPALRSLDDFKAGKRELLADDFARAEKRMRRACVVVMPGDQVDSAVAKMFAESALEKARANEPERARATIAAGLRINPADAALRDLQTRLGPSGSALPQSRGSTD